MERVFQLPPTTYIGGDRSALPLRDIIERLEVSFSESKLAARRQSIRNTATCNREYWVRESLEFTATTIYSSSAKWWLSKSHTSWPTNGNSEFEMTSCEKLENWKYCISSCVGRHLVNNTPVTVRLHWASVSTLRWRLQHGCHWNQLKQIELLQNGVATNFGVTPFFSMRALS